MKRFKSRIAIIEGYKAERFKKEKIDIMAVDALITPLPVLVNRYSYSAGFIRKVLKDRGIKPKKMWGHVTMENHQDATQHHSMSIPDLSEYGDVTARGHKHHNFYATNGVWK